MMIELPILQFLLGLVSAITLIVMGFVFRSINKQNDILIVLSQQVGTMSYPLVDNRLINLEADMARVWKWKEEETKRLLDAK